MTPSTRSSRLSHTADDDVDDDDADDDDNNGDGGDDEDDDNNDDDDDERRWRTVRPRRKSALRRSRPFSCSNVTSCGTNSWR